MPANSLHFLLIGDVVGKAGRAAVTKILPELRQKYRPDAVIMNVENLAHGNGITPDTITEMEKAGADYFTSGNHIWDNKDGLAYLQQQHAKVIRPANLPLNNPGKGYLEFSIGTRKILLINLTGQVFMPQQANNPFHCLDEILKQHSAEQYSAIIVDLHAEATSEKQALAAYADGRISLLIGTHTHVPTADLRTLPKGTGLVCDVGSVVSANSIIGAEADKVLYRFLTQMPQSLTPAESSPVLFNSVLCEIDPATKKTLSLKRIDQQINL
ncbi:MAG: TIGR00282 family metallophosphoesterase [Patescibacteria group bacterium]|jgi:hypothetical protein